MKVLDFGTARFTHREREARTQGFQLGTRGYMSPERYDGLDTPACDVNGLGVVLFEMVARERPFAVPVVSAPGTPRESRHAQQIAARIACAAHRVRVPEDLWALLREMLAWQPEERPDALTVARRLRELLPGLAGAWLVDWAPVAVDLATSGVIRPQARPPSPRPVALPPPPDPTSEISVVEVEPRGGGGLLILLGLALCIWAAAAALGVLLVVLLPRSAPLEVVRIGPPASQAEVSEVSEAVTPDPPAEDSDPPQAPPSRARFRRVVKPEPQALPPVDLKVNVVAEPDPEGRESERLQVECAGGSGPGSRSARVGGVTPGSPCAVTWEGLGQTWRGSFRPAAGGVITCRPADEGVLSCA